MLDFYKVAISIPEQSKEREIVPLIIDEKAHQDTSQHSTRPSTPLQESTANLTEEPKLDLEGKDEEKQKSIDDLNISVLPEFNAAQVARASTPPKSNRPGSAILLRSLSSVADGESRSSIFQTSQNDEDAVIIIKAISSKSISKFRTVIQKFIIEGFNNWKDSITSPITNQVAELFFKYQNLLNENLYVSEEWHNKVEKVHRKRLEDLENIENICKQQSRQLVGKQIKAEEQRQEQAKEEHALDLMAVELVGAVDDVIDARFSSTITRVITKSTNEISEVKAQIASMIDSSTLKFNSDIETLQEQKVSGSPFHPKVWRMWEVKNLGGFQDLNNFKNTVISQFSKLDGDTNAIVSSKSDLLKSHFNDLVFKEDAGRILQQMRLQIRAICLDSSNQFSELERLLNALIDRRENKKITINNDEMYEILSMIEDIREAIFKYANYLKCNKLEQIPVYRVIQSFSSWKEKMKKIEEPVPLKKGRATSSAATRKSQVEQPPMNHIANELNFNDLVDTLRSNTRFKIATLAETYYKTLETKKNLLIPPTLTHFIKDLDKELNEYSISTESKRCKSIDDLKALIKRQAMELKTTFNKIYTIFLHENLNLIEDSWRVKSAWYNESMNILSKTRLELKRLFKPSLGHPDQIHDLFRLEAENKERIIKFDLIINDMRSRVNNDFSTITNTLITSLEYVSSSLLSSSSLFLELEDIIRPIQLKEKEKQTLESILIAKSLLVPDILVEGSDTAESRPQTGYGLSSAISSSFLAKDLLVVAKIDLKMLECSVECNEFLCRRTECVDVIVNLRNEVVAKFSGLVFRFRETMRLRLEEDIAHENEFREAFSADVREAADLYKY